MSEIAAPSAPARRRRRSTEEIRRRILVAATAEFKEKGYDRTSTISIAKRARVIEAQIYNHFQSKANLFRNVIFDPLNEDLRRLSDQYHWSKGQPDNFDDFLKSEAYYVARLLSFLEDNLGLIKSALVAGAYGSLDISETCANGSLSEYFDQGTAIMRTHMAADAKIDPRIMVRISFAAVLGCVIFKKWLFPDGMMSDEAIAKAINEFTLEGLAVNHATQCDGPPEANSGVPR